MKSKIKMAISATVFALCFNYQNALAQWTQASLFTGSSFGRTNAVGPAVNWVRSIGVGNFPLGTFPNSCLHVNSNFLLLPTNGSITSLGEVFRTDCPGGLSTFWRMFRGGNRTLS